ncbi:DUF1365 domain-containing protein [Photobacterium nomapromontoriensis]|uniref:DUF1365 domain-containing protein n=1 Tax=Photobacterium nomapromontoriensis TaxID=2910237 RepID=UPI003D0F28C7
MNSALFIGTVRHRRFMPVVHRFSYPMFMPLIDLDEVEQLESTVTGFGHRWWHFARLNALDYLPHEIIRPTAADDYQTLKHAVIAKSASLGSQVVDGRVMMLCQLRYAGIYFSPINLYYLYDNTGRWQSVLVEVSNTPWNKRHYYLLPATEYWSSPYWREDKQFHVSPFNPMTQYYNWRLNEPHKHVLVHLDIHDNSNDKKVLDATMGMKRMPFSSLVLWRLIAATPIQTIKVVIGIYWQALRLWLKKSPFYDYPRAE